jgi:hypothetical protein
MKIEFCEQIFEKKMTKYQISRKSVQWETSCFMREDGRKTGRHDKANSRLLQILRALLKARESNSNLEELTETTDVTRCYNYIFDRREVFTTPECLWYKVLSFKFSVGTENIKTSKPSSP